MKGINKMKETSMSFSGGVEAAERAAKVLRNEVPGRFNSITVDEHGNLDLEHEGSINLEGYYQVGGMIEGHPNYPNHPAFNACSYNYCNED